LESPANSVMIAAAFAARSAKFYQAVQPTVQCPSNHDAGASWLFVPVHRALPQLLKKSYRTFVSGTWDCHAERVARTFVFYPPA